MTGVVSAMTKGLVGGLVWLIRGYRAALTPFFGPSCRFEPSCSRYAEEALATHGLRRGVVLAAVRICRCHPFGSSGLDPVPEPRPSAARAHG